MEQLEDTLKTFYSNFFLNTYLFCSLLMAGISFKKSCASYILSLEVVVLNNVLNKKCNKQLLLFKLFIYYLKQLLLFKLKYTETKRIFKVGLNYFNIFHSSNQTKAYLCRLVTSTVSFIQPVFIL